MEEQRQTKLLTAMRDIVVRVLESVDDNTMRVTLLDKLADEFEKVGIA
jgi:hypothetical protein